MNIKPQLIKKNKTNMIQKYKITIDKPYTINFDTQYLEKIIKISSNQIHYNNHFLKYYENLKKQIQNIDEENKDINYIIEKYKKDEHFMNNAHQIANHIIFWECFRPQNINTISSYLHNKDEIFFQQTTKLGINHFGSGWLWIIENKQTKEITKDTTKNANTYYLSKDFNVICCIDIWEHSYYLDYQSNKSLYIKKILKLYTNKI